MKSTRISNQIIDIAKRLYNKNFLAAADGNISYRINDEKILITPSGQHKGFIENPDIAHITTDNKIIKGTPSTERLMHLTIYQNCTKAKAVIHAHPPYAIAWSISHPHLQELPKECLSELILAVGQIPIIPYARPGTQDMGEKLVPFLPDQRVFILGRHGALSWGETLDEAYNGIERLEHTAYILALSQMLGGLTSLPPQEIEALQSMRSKIGPKTL